MNYKQWSNQIVGVIMTAGLAMGCGAGGNPPGSSGTKADLLSKGSGNPEVEACKGLKADEACRFTIDSKTLVGVCHEISGKSELLVCGSSDVVPANNPAVAACENVKVDAPCKYTVPGGKSFEGICVDETADEGVIKCVSPKPVNPSFEACQGLKEYDLCQITSDTSDSLALEGVCHEIAGKSDLLACFPGSELVSPTVVACKNLKVDAPCEYIAPGGKSIKGICVDETADEGVIACVSQEIPEKPSKKAASR